KRRVAEAVLAAQVLDRGARGRLLQEANDLLVRVSLLHVRLPLGDGLYLSQPGPENGGQVTWYVLLATQANLIRLRNVKLHRRLGIATFIVAIGVTLSTLYIFIVVWKGWGNMSEEVRAN